MKPTSLRLLMFNLATDTEDPILGFTTAWIRALAQRVKFVNVITMRAGRVDVPDNVRVYSVGKEKGYSKAVRATEFYRRLIGILTSEQIDICFSHMMPIFTVLAAPVLKLRHVPILTWFAHPSLTITLILAHSLSTRMLTSVPTAYPYKRDKLTVMGQGIDTQLFAPKGTRSEDEVVILAAGRLSPVKDHLTLLEGVRLLQRRWRNPIRVVIVGGPASPQDEGYVQSLREHVERLGMRNVVQFVPPVSMSSLPPFYRQSTLHVNLTPSGFGDKVALEAMGCGRPCLVANEGFRETLGDYAKSLLFRYKDPIDLADKMEGLLTLSSAEQESLGTYLRNRVIQMHSLERLADRLVDVFEQVSVS